VVQWTTNGVAISTAIGDQHVPQIVSDGTGGDIITWSDYRNGSNFDIYAQNVTANGMIGCTPPLITNQPLISQTVFQGATPADLTVTATGAGLSYQWYSNTTASTTGAVNLNPAGTAATFTPSTITTDTTYYYCVVTNTCDTINSNFPR
jgi:hypothetical protein